VFFGHNFRKLYKELSGQERDMKFYLSSYKLGNEIEKLKSLVSKNKNKLGYIPNALDFSKADPEEKTKHIESDMNDLKAIGFDVELLDLRDYFGR